MWWNCSQFQIFFLDAFRHHAPAVKNRTMHTVRRLNKLQFSLWGSRHASFGRRTGCFAVILSCLMWWWWHSEEDAAWKWKHESMKAWTRRKVDEDGRLNVSFRLFHMILWKWSQRIIWLCHVCMIRLSLNLLLFSLLGASMFLRKFSFAFPASGYDHCIQFAFLLSCFN